MRISMGDCLRGAQLPTDTNPRDRDLRSLSKDKNGMSKGERRGNREAKKPKQDKTKLAAPASNSLAAVVVKAGAPKRK